MTGDVLDTIAGWPAEKQLVANQAIREVEQEVCDQHCNLRFISHVKVSCAPFLMLLHGNNVQSSVQTKRIMTVCSALCTQGLSMVVFSDLV